MPITDDRMIAVEVRRWLHELVDRICNGADEVEVTQPRDIESSETETGYCHRLTGDGELVIKYKARPGAV